MIEEEEEEEEDIQELIVRIGLWLEVLSHSADVLNILNIKWEVDKYNSIIKIKICSLFHYKMVTSFRVWNHSSNPSTRKVIIGLDLGLGLELGLDLG